MVGRNSPIPEQVEKGVKMVEKFPEVVELPTDRSTTSCPPFAMRFTRKQMNSSPGLERVTHHSFNLRWLHVVLSGLIHKGNVPLNANGVDGGSKWHGMHETHMLLSDESRLDQ
ncbi:unnamed protein product [Acanthocheilonema viteae]|uniref:Uncharacterized protein n=1 Tax=Acanthocheilonema viteae TaxID=6277 RepID=A0A498SIM3_ACAVI|nr:unnamed protein product [Acanthocheilonema viteae]